MNQIKNAVILNGFGVGKESAAKIADAYAEFTFPDKSHFNDVRSFRLIEYLDNPGLIEMATRDPGTILSTHSAASLALENNAIIPDFALVMNAPVAKSVSRRRGVHMHGAELKDTTVPYLVRNTLVKQARTINPRTGAHNRHGIRSGLAYNYDSFKEIFRSRHAIATHKRLLGRIAQTDSIAQVGSARSRGSEATMLWTDGDVYFCPPFRDLRRATELGIATSILPGEHDEIILRPKTFVTLALNRALDHKYFNTQM